MALLLKSFTLETRFPRDFQELLPPAVIEYLALQLETPPNVGDLRVAWPYRAHARGGHARMVRVPHPDRRGRSAVVALARHAILPANITESHVVDVAFTWYREQGIERFCQVVEGESS